MSSWQPTEITIANESNQTWKEVSKEFGKYPILSGAFHALLLDYIWLVRQEILTELLDWPNQVPYYTWWRKTKESKSGR